MEWSRTGSYLDLALWGGLSLVVWASGWLLCAGLFRLRSRERLASGLAVGLLLVTLLVNLLAQFLSLDTAYWLAAGLLLVFALLAAWREKVVIGALLADVRHVGPLLSLGVLFLIMLGINRGLALFDDYSNIPLVSMVATGDVPPRFFLNPTKVLDYHYGLHLMAAGLVRIGGFYPWTALDVYKAFSMSLAAVLGVLWYRRFARLSVAVLGGGLFVLFAGGTRWLLLLFPPAWLEIASRGVVLTGSMTAATRALPQALSGAWAIHGAPFPFPFAFVAGFARPLTLAMGSGSALPEMSLFLLLLLGRRTWRPLQGTVFGLLVAATALISESLFVVVLGGIALTMLWHGLRTHSWNAVKSWFWVLLPGVILVPWMGGVLSVTLARALGWLRGEPVEMGLGVPGVGLRWPPAVLSPHLGPLSLTDPGQLLIALVEMGPLLFLAPLVTWVSWNWLRRGKLLLAGLGLMAWVSFLVPIFVRFVEFDRNISRLTGAALSLWGVLGLPYVWMAFRRGRETLRVAIGVAYMVTLIGGLGLLPAQLTAILQPQASYYIEEPDLWMARDFWNQLEGEAWVLDPRFAFRPAAIFGRTTGPAYRNLYVPEPEFERLLERFSPRLASQAGYDYLYIDRYYWRRLAPEQRRLFQDECVVLVAERKTALGDFRRLYNIQGCRSTP